ncbi:hypothetical protein VNO78_19944 [Psophocarpus tetragonolobus]|uniref:Uncharacterized protein n=1 Tax=Psophocarpus tetragonolobus TaxID=3891 RepID=A0AAN9S8I3_PSOTE
MARRNSQRKRAMNCAFGKQSRCYYEFIQQLTLVLIWLLLLTKMGGCDLKEGLGSKGADWERGKGLLGVFNVLSKIGLQSFREFGEK